MEYYLRRKTVKEITGLSDSTLWRKEQDGSFPRRRKISNRAVGWLSSEVEAWLEQTQREEEPCK